MMNRKSHLSSGPSPCHPAERSDEDLDMRRCEINIGTEILASLRMTNWNDTAPNMRHRSPWPQPLAPGSFVAPRPLRTALPHDPPPSLPSSWLKSDGRPCACEEVPTRFGFPTNPRSSRPIAHPGMRLRPGAMVEARRNIAGAGGAAHLPGMVAAHTILPVLGVPVETQTLKGLDSLLSIAQMPAGVPVGTLAIGKAGATNAALLAIAILANSRPELREKLQAFRDEQTESVRSERLV